MVSQFRETEFGPSDFFFSGSYLVWDYSAVIVLAFGAASETCLLPSRPLRLNLFAADWRAWTVGLFFSRFICSVWSYSVVVTLAFGMASLIYLFPTKLVRLNLLVTDHLSSLLSRLVLRKGASPFKVAGRAANSQEKHVFPLVIPGQGGAVMAAAAVEPVFQFVLLQRGAEGDEMLVLAPVDGSQEHAALTNTADGQAFTWAFVRLAPGNWGCCRPDLVNRLVAPPPMKNLNINWLCSPPLAVD